MLFCVNLIINYFLLLACIKIHKEQRRFRRLLAGAAVGAAASFFIFLPSLNTVADIFFKIFLSIIIVYTAFGYKNKKRFVRLFATFFLVSFAFAGIMIAVWFLWEPPGLLINNSVVYFDISPILLIVSCVISYIIIMLISMFTRRKITPLNEYYIEIFLENKSVYGKAMHDTANNLCDLFSGDPVVVTDFDFIKALIKVPALATFKNTHSPPDNIDVDNFRLIPYTTVSKSGFLPAFRPDCIILTSGGKTVKIKNVLIAVSREPLESNALIGNEVAAFIE